ncbi:hypothetical protein CR513_21487, partial [Mucuna pruriens]
MLLLQEFNLEIRDRKGVDNIVVDHLSRIKGKVDPVPIRDYFPDEQLLLVAHSQPWFSTTFPLGASKYYKEKIQSDAKHYIWDDSYLWRCCNDCVIRSRSSIFAILHFEAATMDPPR